MKSVFILWHTHETPEQAEDSKLIGVYESRGEAERARERTSRQPGFAQHLEGFLIDEYKIGKDHWTEGFVTVAHDGEEKEPNPEGCVSLAETRPLLNKPGCDGR